MSLQFVVTKPRGPLGWWIVAPILGVAVGILWWSAVGTQFSLSELIDGLPWIGDFLGRMLPPNFAFMDKLVQPAIETVQIALWGTLLGIVLALPICFFAARNLSPQRRRLPWAAPGAERDARHQRDHPRPDLRRGRRPRALRRRAGHRLPRRRHAGQVLRRGDRGDRRGPARRAPRRRRGHPAAHRVRRAAPGPADLDRRGALPLRDQHPRLDRARHGGRGRHRLRADQLA